jgi:hypothetical protein
VAVKLESYFVWGYRICTRKLSIVIPVFQHSFSLSQVNFQNSTLKLDTIVLTLLTIPFQVNLQLLYINCCDQKTLKNWNQIDVVQRNVTVRWLTFLPHIRQVPGSYPYLNTDYLDCCYHDVPQSLQAFVWVVHQPLPSTSLQNHYTLVIVSLEYFLNQTGHSHTSFSLFTGLTRWTVYS